MNIRYFYDIRMLVEHFESCRSCPHHKPLGCKYLEINKERKNSLELIELSSINKVSLVQVFSCRNTGSIRDDPYWTSGKNSLKLIDLSSINKVSLV